jgi:hypothetical protein
MEAVDGVNLEVARLFAAKEKRRRPLVQLPFPEKVRAVLKLQEMAALVLKARGRSRGRGKLKTKVVFEMLKR